LIGGQQCADLIEPALEELEGLCVTASEFDLYFLPQRGHLLFWEGHHTLANAKSAFSGAAGRRSRRIVREEKWPEQDTPSIRMQDDPGTFDMGVFH
jgi:hypothetical protein